MFERFTDRARKVLVRAQEEVRLLDHDFIGAEHILLGLIVEGDGVAAEALRSLGVTLGPIRDYVAQAVTPARRRSRRRRDKVIPPFTLQAKTVLELSARHSAQLGHNRIGPEHLLLAVIGLGDDDVAIRALVALGTEPSQVREAVLTMIGGEDRGKSRLNEPAPDTQRSVTSANRQRLSRTQYQLAGNPAVLGVVRATIWAAALRGATRARWRTCLAAGTGLAVGSMFARRRTGHSLGRRGEVLRRWALPDPAVARWSRMPAPLGVVPSPGGWVAPAGMRPMWNWTPSGGGRARLDRVPWPVRVWYELPFLDRYAHAWMWHHGGWDVSPRPSTLVGYDSTR